MTFKKYIFVICALTAMFSALAFAADHPPQSFTRPIRPTPLLPIPTFTTPNPTDPTAVAARARALIDLGRNGSGILNVPGLTPTRLITIRQLHPRDPIEISLFNSFMTPVPVQAVAHRPGMWNDLNRILDPESPFLVPPTQGSGPSAGQLGGAGTGGSPDHASLANWLNWFGSWGGGTFQYSQTVATSGHWPILNMQMISPSLYGFSLNFNRPPPNTITYDVWMQRHGNITLGIPGADLFIRYSDADGDGIVDTYTFYRVNPGGTFGAELSPQEFLDYGIHMGYWYIDPSTNRPVLNPNKMPPIIVRCEENTRNGVKYYSCYDATGALVVSATSPRAIGVIDLNPNGTFMYYSGAMTGYGIVPIPTPPPPRPPQVRQ